MSYYTRVEFLYSDEPPGFDDITGIVRSYLESQNLYAVEPVIEDLRRGWTEGFTEFNGLVVDDIEGIMNVVSAAYPKMCFYVRGMGEEYCDIWLRRFQGGAIDHAVGPFEEFD